MEKEMTFEERLAQVETIAAQLEEGKLGLEDSMKKYELGVQLLSALEKELGSAKQRLSMIQRDASGQPEEVPAMEVVKGFIPVEDGGI